MVGSVGAGDFELEFLLPTAFQRIGEMIADPTDAGRRLLLAAPGDLGRVAERLGRLSLDAISVGFPSRSSSSTAQPFGLPLRRRAGALADAARINARNRAVNRKTWASAKRGSVG